MVKQPQFLGHQPSIQDESHVHSVWSPTLQTLYTQRTTYQNKRPNFNPRPEKEETGKGPNWGPYYESVIWISKGFPMSPCYGPLAHGVYGP